MIIFSNTLKRLFKNKYTMLLILVLPPLFIGVLFGLSGGGISSINVGLVDKDNTEFTRQMEEVLGEKAHVRQIEEEQIQNELASGRINYVLVINNGFTEDILKGSEPSILSYSIQESNLSIPVRLYAESFIRAARNLAAAAGGNESLFYSGLKDYRSGNVKTETRVAGIVPQKQAEGAVSCMGLLGLFMLFLAMLTTINIIQDQENRTFHRIMASSLKQSSYMIQKTVAFLFIMLVQITVVFLVSNYLIGIYLGASVPALFGVMAVFSVVCIAFAVAISAIARTTRQASASSALLIMPMSMLGGLFWPREIMPEILQQVGQFMPTAWMIDAANKVVYSGRLLDAGWEILIMLLYAGVFFLLGNWRRVDVAVK